MDVTRDSTARARNCFLDHPIIESASNRFFPLLHLWFKDKGRMDFEWPVELRAHSHSIVNHALISQMYSPVENSSTATLLTQHSSLPVSKRELPASRPMYRFHPVPNIALVSRQAGGSTPPDDQNTFGAFERSRLFVSWAIPSDRLLVLARHLLLDSVPRICAHYFMADVLPAASHIGLMIT